MFAEELNRTAIIGYPLPGERDYQRGDANTCYSYPCLVILMTVQDTRGLGDSRETSGRERLRGDSRGTVGRREREGVWKDGSDERAWKAALLGKASERRPGQAQQWVGKGDVACLIGLGADRAAHEVYHCWLTGPHIRVSPSNRLDFTVCLWETTPLQMYTSVINLSCFKIRR